MYVTVPTIATNSVALAVGNASVTIIAAPPVQQTLRLVAVTFGINRNSGAGIVDMILQDGAANIYAKVGAISIGGLPSMHIVFPEPGIQVSPGQRIDLLTQGTVAAGQGFATIYYYTDTIL